MFRVRYPNGLTIQYNGANYLTYGGHAWELFTRKDGAWVASVQLSAGAIIEAVPACRIYNASEQSDHEQMDALRKDLAAIRRKISKLSTAERKRRNGQ